MVHLLPRVYVPSHSGGARLPGAGRGLPGQRRIWPRLADGGIPAHGRQGSGRYRGRGEVCRGAVRRGPEEDRAVRRQLRRVHHADGHVHRARYFRGGRGAASGDRLGDLQPRLHQRYPEHAAGRCGGVPEEQPDFLRGRLEGRAPDLPWHGGYQCGVSGHGAADAAADRIAQGELVGGSVPGGGSLASCSPPVGRTSTSGF